MPENTSQQSDKQLPGASLADYQSAVRALVDLRDSGKCTVLTSRTYAVRIVGTINDIHRAISSALKRDIEIAYAAALISEIENFCQSRVYFSDIEKAIAFLIHNVFDVEEEDDGEEREDEEENAEFVATLKDQVRQKLEVVLGLLPPMPTVKQRLQRLRTATSGCLEEVDMEIIRERQDDLRRISISEPFLRIRIRYTGATTVGCMPWAYRAPWGGIGPVPCDTFELECDDVDIDVLMHRLVEAKRLLSAVSKGDSNKSQQ